MQLGDSHKGSACSIITSIKTPLRKISMFPVKLNVTRNHTGLIEHSMASCTWWELDNIHVYCPWWFQIATKWQIWFSYCLFSSPDFHSWVIIFICSYSGSLLLLLLHSIACHKECNFVQSLHCPSLNSISSCLLSV